MKKVINKLLISIVINNFMLVLVKFNLVFTFTKSSFF